MIDRSRALKLKAVGSERNLRQTVIALLTNKAERSLFGSKRRRWFAV